MILCQCSLGWRAAAGGWGLKALTGGVLPTVPLWSLRLTLGFSDSGPALAAAAVARAALAAGNFPVDPASWYICFQAVWAARLAT